MTVSIVARAVQESERLRGVVLDREVGALIDLANWLHADGVPLEQMDGSVQSLIPLWVWFKAQVGAGYPAPEPGRTALGQAFLSVSPDAVPRLLVGEVLAYYFMQVIRRIDPHARWDVELAYWISDYGRPVARWDSGSRDLFGMIANVGGQLTRGDLQRERDDAFQTLALLVLGDDEALRATGPSILASSLGGVPPRVDYSAMKIEIPEPEPRVAQKDRAHGEYFLSINLEEQERRDESNETDSGPDGLVPLPTAPLVRFLNEAGFTLNGPLTEEAVRDAKSYGVTVTHKELWAFAEITVAEGEPRLVMFRAFESTKAEWRGLLKSIRAFAASIGARLVQ